jgi:hypothetical protein
VLKRGLQLAMSVATALAGALLALVLAPGADVAALGWVIAGLGLLGAVTCLLLPRVDGPR